MKIREGQISLIWGKQSVVGKGCLQRCPRPNAVSDTVISVSAGDSGVRGQTRPQACSPGPLDRAAAREQQQAGL